MRIWHHMRAVAGLVVGGLIALIIVIMLLEQHILLRSQICAYVHTMLVQSFRASVRLRMGAVRLLHEYAAVENVVIVDPDQGWTITAGRMVLRFSWRTLVQERVLHVTVALYDVAMASLGSGSSIAIKEPLQRLFAATSTAGSVVIDAVVIHDGTVTVRHNRGLLEWHGGAHLPCGAAGGAIRLWLHDGYIAPHGMARIDAMQLQYHGEASKKMARVDFRCNLAALDGTVFASKKSLSVAAQQHNELWSMQVHAADDIVKAAFEYGVASGTFSGSVQLPVDYASSLCGKQQYGLGGAAQLTVEGAVADGGIAKLGIVGTIDPLQLPGIGSPLRLAAQYPTQGGSSGFSASLERLCSSPLLIDVSFDAAAYRIRIGIAEDLQVGGGYTLCAAGSEVLVRIDTNDAYTIRYHGSVSHDTSGDDPVLHVDGNVEVAGAFYTVDGHCNEYHYASSGRVAPVPTITRLFCEQHGTILVDLMPEGAAGIKGMVDYQMFARIALLAGYTLPGAGTCMVAGSIGVDRIALTYDMQDANIKIPHLYNIIEGFSGSLVCIPSSGIIRMKDVRCLLHRGYGAVSDGVIMIGPDRTVQFYYIPWLLHECLVSWGKDIFAEFSGAGIIEYRPGTGGKIVGLVVGDRMHMRNNIFSPDIVRSFKGTVRPSTDATDRPELPGMFCDLTCITRRPLHIKTSFLEASALGSVRIVGPISAVKTHGTISIVQGSFLFPYKQLFITRGSITLSPQLMDDPLIDVIAENSVKGYHVRLHLSGSIKEPSITFQSIPALPEEQIIGLLWGGSEDGALYLAMSATIMKSIERLILGPSDSSSGLMRSLQSVFRPLGSVRFVPSFTDQSGRGGLRGSLAIEVDDRLRGIIKQNFDLPQDTMLEVEYAISDDSRVRVVKDERGDLGGEFEASWKL